MSDFDGDMVTLQKAVQLFAQTLKRPQRWAAITQQANLSIDRPAAHILHTLLACEPQQLRVQDVAARLSIEPPSVTRKTQELERSGYLERVPDPEDRRAMCLRITAAGREVAERLGAIQRQTMAEALADWPEADRTQFVNLFQKFSEDLAENSNTTT